MSAVSLLLTFTAPILGFARFWRLAVARCACAGLSCPLSRYTDTKSCPISPQDFEANEKHTMSATPRIGQMLKGRLGSYTVTSKLYESVWKGRYDRVTHHESLFGCADHTNSDSQGSNVVVKSVNHWRLQSERDVLLRYQSRNTLHPPTSR